MIALYIIAAVFLLFFLLFSAKIRVELKFLGGVLDFKVKYLCFTVFPLKEKKPKKRGKGKKSANDAAQLTESQLSSDADKALNDVESAVGTTAEEAAEAPVKPKDKKKLSDTLNMVNVRIEQFKLLWETVKKFFTGLFKGIRITNLMIDFVISGEDACAAAVNYGKVSAAVYNAIALLKLMFKVSVKTVDIGCEFESKKSSYDCTANITLGLGTAVGLLLGAAFGYLKNKSKIDELGNSLNSPDSDKENLRQHRTISG